jgi:UDP:flavonoid glycosyltransferase YjiC (YdhE family)
MRVLCTCSPAYGHFHPMVPLARALLEAGHELAFATAADFCPRVEQSGFRCFPSGLKQPERGEHLRRVLAEMEAIPPLERARFGFCRVFAETGAPAMMPDLMSLLGEFRPQLLIHETSEMAGPLAATVAGIPYVNHSYGHLIPDDVAQAAALAVARLWTQWGHRMPPSAGMFQYLYLDICPPSLQFPRIEEISVSRRLRPIPFDAAGDEGPPAWIDSLGPGPTVYVTLGTVFNGASQLFQNILEGLRDEPVNVIVTVGANADPVALGPQPDHIHIARYIPQTQLFPRCDAVVSHGGSGTMYSALGAGLPLLSIPQGADQFRNAERCVTAGVGRSLWPHEVTSEAVRRDVTALLREPTYRERARRVQTEIDEMPPPESLVPVLEELAAA